MQSSVRSVPRPDGKLRVNDQHAPDMVKESHGLVSGQGAIAMFPIHSSFYISFGWPSPTVDHASTVTPTRVHARAFPIRYDQGAGTLVSYRLHT